MQYYMNLDKSGRYILTQRRNVCPKTAVNLSAVSQFANWKKPASFMKAVLSLITWFLLVMFQVSTIATSKKRREERRVVNRERNITLRIISWLYGYLFRRIRPLKMIKNKGLFFSRSRKLAEFAHTMTVWSPSLLKRKPLQIMQE